ncbi:MAG: tripartite tricarboxylate transporter permease [Pirellulaceae bacterium]
MLHFTDLLHPTVIVLWLLGMLFGIFVGATPGLTATMAVALIVPIAISMEPAAGLAMIIGVSFTAIFAGDIPATYLRIPGTPASAAATLDGFAMAQKGRGRQALMIDLFCSALGGLVGVLLLILVAPLLARAALAFGSQEKMWLAVLGLSMSAVVSQGSTIKGLLAALLGVLLATVGNDVATAQPRYSLGLTALQRETSDFLIPAMIGLFGLSEVLRSVRHKESMAKSSAVDHSHASLSETLAAIWRNKFTALGSSIIGTVIGALPGAGADIAAWGAYGIAQRTSRKPEQFGTGCEQGVIAPTSANNAAVAGAWIPALVFGVPGDAVTAIVLGALVMYDVTPGPAIFESGGPVYIIFVIALITQLLLLPAGLAGIYGFGFILRLPRSIVFSAVLLFSVVGAYAINQNIADVGVMIGFGLLGYYLESQKVPLAPLILGMILGVMIETYLRASLIASHGDVAALFTRPISMGLVALLVLAMVGVPLFKAMLKWGRRTPPHAS